MGGDGVRSGDGEDGALILAAASCTVERIVVCRAVGDAFFAVARGTAERSADCSRYRLSTLSNQDGDPGKSADSR